MQATITTSHVLGEESALFADVQRCYQRWDPATPPGLRLRPAEDIPPDEDEVDASDRFEAAQRTRFISDIRYTTSPTWTCAAPTPVTERCPRHDVRDCCATSPT